MTPKKKGARKNSRHSTKKARPIRYNDLPELEWIAIGHDGIVAHAPTLNELDAILGGRPSTETIVFSRVFPRCPQAWGVWGGFAPVRHPRPRPS